MNTVGHVNKQANRGVVTGKPVVSRRHARPREGHGSGGGALHHGVGAGAPVQPRGQHVHRAGLRQRGSHARGHPGRYGASLTAVGDHSGYLCPGGLQSAQAGGVGATHGSVAGYPSGQAITREEFFATKCDIFIPAALEGQIGPSEANLLDCKLIVEGANGPTTPEGEKRAARPRDHIIPDVLANSGGVTVSYYEWVQNKRSESWDLEEVDGRLENGDEARLQGRAELSRAQAATRPAPRGLLPRPRAPAGGLPRARHLPRGAGKSHRSDARERLDHAVARGAMREHDDVPRRRKRRGVDLERGVGLLDGHAARRVDGEVRERCAQVAGLAEQGALAAKGEERRAVGGAPFAPLRLVATEPAECASVVGLAGVAAAVERDALARWVGQGAGRDGLRERDDLIAVDPPGVGVAFGRASAQAKDGVACGAAWGSRASTTAWCSKSSPTAAWASRRSSRPTCWARCRSSSRAPTSRSRSTSPCSSTSPSSPPTPAPSPTPAATSRASAPATTRSATSTSSRPEALDHQRPRRPLVHGARDEGQGPQAQGHHHASWSTPTRPA
jgi:hypothetical protein